VEAPVEVGQPLAQRALDRVAHQEPVEGASPPGARLIFDRDPIDELVVDLLEVAQWRAAGRPRCSLSGLRTQPPIVSRQLAGSASGMSQCARK
jgi:hypothetical protein